ncbi:MAG: hypothetical protein IIU75_05535, partial [Rikenellaceae bacterium]|nr:hypothetical protein [Rikenellaceae bacterium]
MRRLIYILMLVVMVACGEAPTSYRQCPELPPMHPNYADITIPYNIAPLNFEIDSVEHIEL